MINSIRGKVHFITWEDNAWSEVSVQEEEKQEDMKQ